MNRQPTRQTNQQNSSTYSTYNMCRSRDNTGRKRVAVLFGGRSPEHAVSLASAAAVLRNLDRERFQPVAVGITRQGNWYYFDGDVDAVEDGSWEQKNCVPACLIPGEEQRALLVFQADGTERLPVDIVFPVLHGSNGEDGAIQGFCQMIDVPVAGCGVLASALCMDKERAHRVAAQSGITVPASRLLPRNADLSATADAAAELGYPLYLKPLRAGSSFGISKLNSPECLPTALENALRYDNQILLEAAIPGFEVGCAVLGGDVLEIGEPDEIELAGDSDYFDYTEKYTLRSAKIHVPARVSPEQRAALRETAARIYRALDCRGFARVDMFLTPSGMIVFHEVNTIPGFTEHSRFPKMMQAAGWSFQKLLTRILELAEETP